MKTRMEMRRRVALDQSVYLVVRKKARREMKRKVMGRTMMESRNLVDPTTSLPSIFTLEFFKHLILSFSEAQAMY